MIYVTVKETSTNIFIYLAGLRKPTHYMIVVYCQVSNSHGYENKLTSNKSCM